MKLYYVLSIAGAVAISTLVGTGLVAAGTGVTAKAETAPQSVEQSAALERLMAQSELGNATWRRPL